MGSFLFLALIIFILWPIIRIAIALFSASRRARKAFTDQYQQQYRQQAQSQPKQRKKFFSSDEGEYVDFEEISATATPSGTASQRHDSPAVEPQISDAEWEEIK